MIISIPLIIKENTIEQMTDKLTELILHLIIQANTAKEVVELYVQYNYPVHLCKKENASVKPNQKFSY